MISNTIADVAQRCLASFDAISQLSAAHIPGSLPSEDARSRYHIWASNLGSLHPGADRRSADYRLREAPEVVERIVELLDELAEINSDILEIVSGSRTNRQITEPEDDLESSDELSELNLSVGDIITSLFKLSMLVKKATTRDRYAKAASAKDAAFLAEFDIRHVADKYPKLRTRPWLLKRLGNAITQRRQFLRYCRNHKNRIAHVAPREAPPNELPARPSRTDGNLDILAHSAHAASTTSTPLTRPTLTPTTASTLHADRIAPEDLQDLDRDDAVSQATSVAYSHMDPEGSGILHVPRLEDISHGVNPFECPFCFGIVQTKKQHSWRKHVLSDLRAYVCMSADCDAGLFEDKAAWQAHDAQYHQRQWSCNQCRNGPFTSAKSLQDHLRSKHEVGELPEDVISKLVDASSHPMTEAAPDCPFCEFENDVRKDATARGQDLVSSAQLVIPLVDYHRHLAFHQEQLALFAIPPEVERSVESESSHGRSKADPQENVQFMARWQNLLDMTDIEDSLEDAHDAAATDAPSPGVTGLGDDESNADDHSVMRNMATGDPSIYMPAEGEFPSILPGDIVYIPQEINEQLSYKKGVYLGRTKDNKHTARDWNSKSEVEVSLATLIRKTDCSTDEKAEAASLASRQSLGDAESQPRHYRKNHLLSSQACNTLLFEASQLAGGERKITGYDEALVKPIFANFAYRFSERDTTDGVRLEDIVRMFYTTATSEKSKDTLSSDAMWKADVERSAALLMKVLIGIVEDQYNFDKDVVAQLRSEQAQMIIRANEAVKLASGSYFRQGFTDRPSIFDDAEGNQLEIDSLALKALRIRVQDVATGQEQLPGFGDEDVKRIFKVFSQFLAASPLVGTSLVEDIVRDFRRCALSELNKDETLDRAQRIAVVRKQEALLLSLLISVDARVQFELHGSAPRNIRSRFSTILMEERARLSFSASKSEALSNYHDLQTGAEAADSRPSDPSSSKLVSGLPILANATNTNVTTNPKTTTTTSGDWFQNFCLVCEKQCEGVYCSQSCRLADLSKASQSDFSPDYSGVPHRTSASGEEALGQYFSERTDKYMNLYRREQPLPKLTSDSHESLSNPWEHLHSASNTSLTRASRTPQEGQPAQTEQHTTRPALETRPKPSAVQWDGMQVVLQLICDYRNEDGSIPSKWFYHRVNEHIIPDYYEIIKEPMDLSKIRQKLEAHAYQSVGEFVYDFALVPFNAQLFNPPGSGANKDALVIERELRKQLRRLVAIGVIKAEDSALPDLGGMPNNDHKSDRSDRLDSSRSGSLLATDASMRSLREWQDNAGKTHQVPSRTSFPKVYKRPLEDSEPESVAKICYTCRHRFAQTANVEEGACPKCGSEFVFTDFPWNTASNVPIADNSDKQESGPALHPLGIAPPQLSDLIQDIEDVAAKLQGLQDRHSKNTNDIPEAVDQLFCLRDGFKRLSRLQENPDYRLRLQRVQENVHVLCSSVRYTVATALSSLRSPLDETQWMALSSSMRYIEHTDLLERLRWYQAAILGLLDHLDGFTSESLLGMDTNIRSLLERQAMIRRSRPAETIPVPSGTKREPSPETSTSNICYNCRTNLPNYPESEAGICQGCGAWFISNPGATSENVEPKEAQAARPNASRESTDPAQPQPQTSTSPSLTGLAASTSIALELLRPLQIKQSRDASIIPEIAEDLDSLLASLCKLSKLQIDPQYDSNFAKVQEPIQVLSRSMQHTLEALLKVLSMEPEAGETKLMQLTILTARMAGEEKVGLPERLRWYSASLLGLLNHLEGFPSAGRIFQWLGMDEKVRSLLERQEGNPGSRKAI